MRAPSQSDSPSRSSDQKFCHACARVMHISAPACPGCGARQPLLAGVALGVGSPTTPVRSRVTAIVLALLLGGLGAHKFYCGQIGLGVLYLVFFWTCIPALIALIEGIVYVVNASSDEEFTRKFCT